MYRFVASTLLALALLTPSVGFAELVKDFTAPAGFRYNPTKPPVGWYAIGPGDFGYVDIVFLLPASKGVAKALGKLDKTKDHSCTIEYDPDTGVAGAYGVYLNVYKAKCTPLP